LFLFVLKGHFHYFYFIITKNYFFFSFRTFICFYPFWNIRIQLCIV